MAERVAGIIEVKGNGTAFAAKGTFTINLGQNKREGIVGSNGKVQGYSEKGQIPFIKGLVTDDPGVNYKNDIANITDATVTLKAANGKTFMWEEAYYSGDGDGDTENGTWQLEFEAVSAEEI